jgi:hypothetical protein
MENGNDFDAPATKQDIQMLRSEFQHGFDELKETVRDAQTELLKAFYNYAQTTTSESEEPSRNRRR